MSPGGAAVAAVPAVRRPAPLLLSFLILTVVAACMPPPERHPIDGLLLALRDPDVWVRWRAYKKLATLGDSPIRSSLDTDDWSRITADFSNDDRPLEVVVAALEAYTYLGLPRFGVHAEAIRELVRSPSTQVRVAALGALAAKGDSDTLPVILEALTFTGDAGVRLAALEAVQKMSASSPTPLLDTGLILDLLEDTDSQVRRETFDRLEELKWDRKSDLHSELLKRIQRQPQTELCLNLLHSMAKTPWKPTFGVARLASLCTPGSAVANDRRIWSQALETATNLQEVSGEELVAALDQPERYDPAVVLALLRSKSGEAAVARFMEGGDSAASPDPGPVLDSYLASGHTVATRINALKLIGSAAASCAYLETTLRLLEATSDVDDPLGELRTAALEVLDDCPQQTTTYLPRLILMMAQPPSSEGFDLLRDAYVETFWRHEEPAQHHLPQVANLLRAESSVVRARAVAVLGRNREASQRYRHELWGLHEELRARSDLDPSGVIRAGVLHALGASEFTEPYLAEIVDMAQSETLEDPFGLVRLAAVDVMQASGVQSLYVNDMIGWLRRDDVSPQVKEGILNVFESSLQAPDPKKAWAIGPEHLALFLSHVYTTKGKRRSANRFNALYLGAESRENQVVLEALGFIEPNDGSLTPAEKKKAVRLCAGMLGAPDINHLLANQLATTIIKMERSESVKWSCGDQDTLQWIADALKAAGYSRESEWMEQRARQFDSERCFTETTGRIIAAVIGVLLLFLLAAGLLRGFRAY